jgi:solute carrier family 25 carnitine/acylcarnitine transporter 20/29
MSAEFWAGSVSGVAAFLIGNPLDVIKVRLQAGISSIPTTSTQPLPSAYQFSGARSLIRGTAAPILSSGALNALLFVTKERTSAFLTAGAPSALPNLWTTWIAGALGGLATWFVSTPTEIVKCRTQISSSPTSNSWIITREILKTEGIRGLYFGGVVTALRDSIGYGWYFWSYELSSRFVVSQMKARGMESRSQEIASSLLCGGLAGVVTWTSIFPLDVIKTRVQTQKLGENASLLTGRAPVDWTEHRRLGAMEITRIAYQREGMGVFFRGLTICSARAFIVNAVQWAVYELIKRELFKKPSVIEQGFGIDS